MLRALLAGAVYFATVFVAAFAFGAVRTFWLEPSIGETWAVATETPFLIAVMFVSARFVLPRLRPPTGVAALLGVGVFALILQQIAEYALVLAAGETLQSHLVYLTTPAGMIYLAALCVFVALPAVLWRRRVWS